MEALYRHISFKLSVLLSVFMSGILPAYAQHKQEDQTTRKERNYVHRGNDLYNSKDYEGALEYYELALMENAMSDAAQYNKALAMYKLSQEAGVPAKENKVIQEADSIFLQVGKNTQNSLIKERAFYNAGNLAYEAEDYDKSIAAYKNALKVNPNNKKTRQNLLLALNKKNENNQQDKQDQQQQQQDQQDQKQQQDQQQQQQPESQPQQKKEISGNSEQILKAMQAQENKTRKDNEKAENASGYVNPKPW